MSRIRSSLLLAAPIALLAACGGGSSAPAETLPADVDLLVKAVPSLKFDKSDYGTVKAGEIMFGYSNEDSVRHTLILLEQPPLERLRRSLTRGRALAQRK